VGPTSSPHENCCLETLATVRMCPEIMPKHHRGSIRCRRTKKDEVEEENKEKKKKRGEEEPEEE